MKRFAQLFSENNAFIINSELLKQKNMDWSIGWIVKVQGFILNFTSNYL
jgi:hypothetical protein